MIFFHRFTEDANNVITRLEKEKMPPEDEHKKQARESIAEKHCISIKIFKGFDQKIEAKCTDFSLWILHS